MKDREKDGILCPRGAKNPFQTQMLMTQITQNMCRMSKYDQYSQEARGPCVGDTEADPVKEGCPQDV